MNIGTSSLPPTILKDIKKCFEGYFAKDPECLVADLVQPEVCAFDLVEVRMLFEEMLGIDFDLITIRQVLENWSVVFT